MFAEDDKNAAIEKVYVFAKATAKSVVDEDDKESREEMGKMIRDGLDHFQTKTTMLETGTAMPEALKLLTEMTTKMDTIETKMDTMETHLKTEMTTLKTKMDTMETHSKTEMTTTEARVYKGFQVFSRNAAIRHKNLRSIANTSFFASSKLKWPLLECGENAGTAPLILRDENTCVTKGEN